MKNTKLEFDVHSFNFGKARRRTGYLIRNLLVFIAVTFTLFVFAYLVFALFFNTDFERRMKKEKEMYETVYPRLESQRELLEDVISSLQYKDNGIYGEVFHSSAPSVDPMSSMGYFFASDTVPEFKIYRYTRDKIDKLVEQGARVDEAFMRIAEYLQQGGKEMPPMAMPVKDISYPQVGASVGKRMNPFYKAEVEHSGIDLIVPHGTEVFAPADGEVIDSKSSTKGAGNTIRIRHKGGYETIFSHLAERYVKAGQRVKAGQKIATVGMSGNAYSPHLHYEVRKDGKVEDPINYFFTSVTPQEYANMLYMSVHTMQSMD